MAKQAVSKKKASPRKRVAATSTRRSTTPAASSKPKAVKVTTDAKKAGIATYAQAVRYLMGCTDLERMRVIRDKSLFKLDRMRHLLSELGNPEKQVRMVHVAGSVGKGSTVAMIASMLEESGYAVGQFTSPHLTDMRERIKIGKSMISRPNFVLQIAAVAKAAEALEQPPTFFEVLTAAAFRYFAEEAIDIAIIETGLGGRLDSTNVITPECTIVTQIAVDHERILGTTVEAIAREKAGIFKPGVPALVFELAKESQVEAVFREVAEEVGAPIQVVNKDIEFSSRFCSTLELGPHTRVCLYTDRSRLEHLPVPLPGAHQAGNCGLALAAIDVLKRAGFDCPDERITAGLAKTELRGRMHLVWSHPRILVDGAHNPESLAALMRCVGAHLPYDSMVCVFGCCQDKDVGAMLDKVNLGADKLIFTKAASNPRAADPYELQRIFTERSGKMSQVADTIPEALELARRAVSRDDLLCVTGSFYLVGEAMTYLKKK